MCVIYSYLVTRYGLKDDLHFLLLEDPLVLV